MPKPETNAVCRVETLFHASRLVYYYRPENVHYRVNDDEQDDVRNEFQTNIDFFEKEGYEIDPTHTTTNATLLRLPKSNLGACLLVPMDEKNQDSPIIIAFRGTLGSSSADIKEDVSLTLTGVGTKAYRDAAYKFYLSVRDAYPDREIVLTGHSLGGHLASYVAAKTIATNENDRKLSVVTFNSASIDTKYQKALKKPENLAMTSRFVNYRADADLVSSVQGRIGDVYSFKTEEKGRLKIHRMDPLKENFPAEILSQEVRPGDPDTKVLERILGFQKSYECILNDKWFHGWEWFKRTFLYKETLFEKTLENIKKWTKEIIDLSSSQPIPLENQKKIQGRLAVLKMQNKILGTLKSSFSKVFAKKDIAIVEILVGDLTGLISRREQSFASTDEATPSTLQQAR